MKFELYQIDAFANKVFEGNPAAVCPLDEWLPGDVMQSIALENNLSETAFFVRVGDKYHIRWFTPTTEVDLCGHATLASAFVIFNELDYTENEIIFKSKSGALNVSREKDWLRMDFPAQEPRPCSVPENILDEFKDKPVECYQAEDYIVVFEDENQVVSAKPDFQKLMKLDRRGVIITSPSKEYDFVNRFFAPKVGVDEDPVTGSAFTQLIPLWSKKLKKNDLMAKQVSQRGGEVKCHNAAERVIISGKAVKYMKTVIEIKD